MKYDVSTGIGNWLHTEFHVGDGLNIAFFHQFAGRMTFYDGIDKQLTAIVSTIGEVWQIRKREKCTTSSKEIIIDLIAGWNIWIRSLESSSRCLVMSSIKKS